MAEILIRSNDVQARTGLPKSSLHKFQPEKEKIMDISKLVESKYLRADQMQGQTQTFTIERVALEEVGRGESKACRLPQRDVAGLRA
jgi:hypothetical protein